MGSFIPENGRHARARNKNAKPVLNGTGSALAFARVTACSYLLLLAAACCCLLLLAYICTCLLLLTSAGVCMLVFASARLRLLCLPLFCSHRLARSLNRSLAQCLKPNIAILHSPTLLLPPHLPDSQTPTLGSLLPSPFRDRGIRVFYDAPPRRSRVTVPPGGPTLLAIGTI